MLLNKEYVDKIRGIVEAKRPYWEKTTGLKFDKDGRAVIGTMSSFNEEQWQELIGSKITKRFEECFEIGLKKMGIEPFPLRSLTFEDYKAKTIKIVNKHGKEQSIKLTRLLQKAQDEWENQMSMYKAFRSHMKEVRNSEEYTQMNLLNNVLNKMNSGNVCIAYDKLLKDNQELEVLISMNPLDKVFASGGPDERYGDAQITKFESCWANEVNKVSEDCYSITRKRLYSNPEAQATLGCHISSGMIIMKNGNQLEVDGMKFFGMAQRSHIWVYDDGVFVENMYPSKYDVTKIAEMNALISKHIKVVEPSKWTKIHASCENFDKSTWFRELRASVSSGSDVYIDRAGIKRDNGDVYITNLFRNANHGGSMWTPRGME